MREQISEERATWARLYTKAEENFHGRQILGLALSFFYYFVSLSPLTRGSAFCGLTLLHGMLLGCGFVATEKLPKGVQLDLEVLLANSPNSFVQKASPWFQLQKVPDLAILHPGNLPSVARSFPTLREVLRGLNMNLGNTADFDEPAEERPELKRAKVARSGNDVMSKQLFKLNDLKVPSVNLSAFQHDPKIS